MWFVYGGWLGYHHVIVEPWRSHALSLAEAVRQKTNRRLEPGERFSVEVLTLYAKRETWRGPSTDSSFRHSTAESP